MSYKPYPAYKDSGVEWLGEIPEGWEVSKTKYICSCNSEVLPEDNNPDMEINYIEISDVQFGLGITQTTLLAFGNAPSRARRIVHSGDIIISTVRTYLRAIAQITTQFEGAIVSTGFAVLRPLRDHPDFIHYLFHASGLHEEIITRSTGVSYPAINAQDLIAIPIPLPPLPTQKAIAAFLDAKTARIDGLVRDYEVLVSLLKEKRQALVSHAVTRGLSELVSPDDPEFGEWAQPVAFKDSGVEWLGEIPEEWEVEKCKHLFIERDERSLDGNEELLSVSHITGVTKRSEKNVNMFLAETNEGYKLAYSNDLVRLCNTKVLIFPLNL